MVNKGGCVGELRLHVVFTYIFQCFFKPFIYIYFPCIFQAPQAPNFFPYKKICLHVPLNGLCGYQK